MPEWSARPRSSTSSRTRAASEVTIPIAVPARATSVLWSMWISNRPDSRERHAAASTTPPGSSPAFRIASASDTPWSSRRDSTAVRSSLPASALLPNVGVLNRAPSSSANAITAIGCGEEAATSNPHATPSGPSKRPPPRTLSRCEPIPHHGGSARGHAHMFPAGSRATRSPLRFAWSSNHARHAASSSVQARRVTPCWPTPMPSSRASLPAIPSRVITR